MGQKFLDVNNASVVVNWGKPNSRVTSRHLSKGFSAFACRLTPLLDADTG